MTWTTPKTWANETLTAADMNTHIRDNLDYLKTTLDGISGQGSAQYLADEASDYTTTSSTFVDVDATNFAHTITTKGGDVLIGFVGVVHTGGNRVFFDVDIDGSLFADDDGIIVHDVSSSEHVSFVVMVTGLSAASHTFKLQWKRNAGTSTLYAGAGVSIDTKPQFWVREI